jgi:carbon-monoxide dehydrogenase medium subunit/6-hydroxypseudooxynicotine dehydrogenase subunit alpha
VKPPPFDYVRPDSLDEALQLLEEGGDEVKLLAGGQSLIPLLNFRLARPERLIDVGRLKGLAYIRETNQSLEIGALTRIAALEHSQLAARLAPLLTEAAAHVAHQQIRNRGTVGGSVAHADPAAEIPLALLALEARLIARSARAERTIAADDFFHGLYTTALEPHEMLTKIIIPIDGGASAFEEFARRSGDFAIGAVACHIAETGATRLAVSGLSGKPVRLRAAEAQLAERAQAPSTAAAAVRTELESAYTGADEFVRRVIVELAMRAYARALKRN